MLLVVGSFNHNFMENIHNTSEIFIALYACNPRVSITKGSQPAKIMRRLVQLIAPIIALDLLSRELWKNYLCIATLDHTGPHQDEQGCWTSSIWRTESQHSLVIAYASILFRATVTRIS